MNDSGTIPPARIMSKGEKYTRVLASLTKRVLAGEMPVDQRLYFLEQLEKMAQPSPMMPPCVNREEIAAIQPMDDRAMSLVDEILKLPPAQTLDVYAENFETFAKLNPSLLVTKASLVEGAASC